MLRLSKLTLTAVLLLFAAGSSADTIPIDLSSWTANNLNLGGPAVANWVLSNSNTTVEQRNNADPSSYTNNLDLDDYTMQGTWQVRTTQDDDYIGFVFGFQDMAHCYVMAWKKSFQDGALEGMFVKKIDAPSLTSLTGVDFSSRGETGNSTYLATNFGTTLGWRSNTLYNFYLRFNAGHSHIVVSQDSTVLWDVTVTDNTYTSGEFGFYNHSQSYVQYSGFTLNTPPECHAGGPYNGDAGVPVQFDASASVDADGSIVSYEWDFGDGTTASGPSPTHTYAADGVYNVTLCVTDNEGLRRCCAPSAPVVPSDETTWSKLKASYR